MHLLGFRFAPRIRDLGDTKLFIPKGDATYDALMPMISSDRLNIRQIRVHWDEILRLATSIKQGTVTASLMLRKLGSYPAPERLGRGVARAGRIERTLFILDWLQSVELRRRVHAGLNKGEARNALASLTVSLPASTAAGTAMKPAGDCFCDEEAQGWNRVGHMPLCPSGGREARNPGVRKALVVERGFFGAAMAEALGNEKAVSGDTQGGMVMKAQPASALVMRKSELLLEFLVIAFDAPAHLGDEDQLFQGGFGRGSREEILGGLGLTFGPFDQQPFLWAHLGAEVIPVSGTNAQHGETGGQVDIGALPPGDRAVGFLRQCHSQRLHGHRFVAWLPAQSCRAYAALQKSGRFT